MKKPYFKFIVELIDFKLILNGVILIIFAAFVFHLVFPKSIPVNIRNSDRLDDDGLSVLVSGSVEVENK